MTNFWDSSVWGSFLVIGLLLAVLLISNIIKKALPFLRRSLVPTSVLGGLLLLVFCAVFKWITGVNFFDIRMENGDYFFGTNGGVDILETLTYHCLALGFIASALKSSPNKISKKRTVEIIDTGATTVSTYLIQGIFGLVITLIVALIIPGFFGAAGILLPFGYGQGTGQAMNYGAIFETEYGFDGGLSFGLTIAALGFLSASVGGVIHLNILRRRGKLGKSERVDSILHSEEIESPDEIPMQESIDKMTLQISLIAVAYMLTYGIMAAIVAIYPGLRTLIYGFNFLVGVLSASLIKVSLKLMQKLHITKERYTNNFLLTRASNLFFDVMVIAGIAAIDLSVLESYWGIMIILGATGFVVTYVYNRFVAAKLFPDYREEQFLMMYGMLTGTASTGIILLREADPDFKTPAADNMVLQNFPAIILGFPMMFLATYAAVRPILTLCILAVYFIGLNLFLFRKFIFRKRNAAKTEEENASE